MAKVQLGDRVRFLNEDIEGTVTRIIDQLTVGVTTDDDFEIPVLNSEVVKVSFSEKAIQTPASKETKPSSEPKIRTELGFFLSFEPKDDGLLQLKLTNLLAQEVIYTFAHYTKNKYTLVRKGSLSLDETATIETLNLSDFSEWPTFVCNMIPCPSLAENVVKPLHKTLKLHAKEFHGSFKFSKMLQKQAYVFRLDEEVNLIDLQKLKDRDFAERAKETMVTWSDPDDVPEVIDLHTGAIPNLPVGLKPSELLQVQFGHFKRMLEKALGRGMEKVTFIHGIGDGVLKRKIKEYLLTHPRIKRAEDADEFRFGKGATEVEFK